MGESLTDTVLHSRGDSTSRNTCTPVGTVSQGSHTFPSWGSSFCTVLAAFGETKAAVVQVVNDISWVHQTFGIPSITHQNRVHEQVLFLESVMNHTCIINHFSSDNGRYIKVFGLDLRQK